METIRGYLGQIKMLDVKIDQRIAELDKLKADAYGVKGMSYDSDRVQTSAASDQTLNIIIRIQEKEMEINKLIDEMCNKRHEIIQEIQSVENCVSMQILYKRYVEFKKWEVIATELNYDYVYLRGELRSKALADFQSTYTILHSEVLK